MHRPTDEFLSHTNWVYQSSWLWTGRRTVELHDASDFWHSPPNRAPVASVLANIEPPVLRRKADTDRLVAKARAHESWPLHHDISNPTPFPLTSRKPLWRESESVDINSQWRESWKSASVVNAHLVDDPSHNPTTGLCFSSTTVVSPEPFPHRTRSLRCM